MARQRSAVPDSDLGQPLPYDRDFKGPLKNRSCTDIICFLLFIAFIVCWIAIGIYAFTAGNINALILPKDSKGRICGVDKHVEDKPYLFFHDITKCRPNVASFIKCSTPQVCVEECPSTTYYNQNGNHQGTLDPQYCVDGKESETCPPWYLPSTSFQHRCIPKMGDIPSNFPINLDTIEDSIKNVKLLADAEEIGEHIVQDIIDSWWKIAIGILFATFVCIIYIAMLRWLASLMVWVSIFGVIGALIAATYFTALKFVELKDDSDHQGEMKLWLGGLILSVIMLIIVLLMLIFLRKRILLAIALIKEGSKAVSSVISVLIFPIVPWILQLGIIAFAICSGLYLSTTGDPVYRIRINETQQQSCPRFINNDLCDPDNFTSEACPNIDIQCKFIRMDQPALYPLLQFLNVFGFFWLAFFASAFGEMVLASVFAQWYWTFNKRNLPFFAVTSATLRVLRYHIGTLAFGSLIIAICRMIRVCLEYIDHKLKKYDNAFTKAILCCLKCFFWCLESFLKFINKNAYIMCAIHGKNFCSSAKDAFMLLMRNIVRVFVLDKVTDFLFFLSTLLVTIGVGAVSYLCFATDLTAIDNSTLHYKLAPVITIMVATFLICSIFFNVYSMAVDTLFLCFLEDTERNDGSPEKPYYMSKNLMKILGKKNKRA